MGTEVPNRLRQVLEQIHPLDLHERLLRRLQRSLALVVLGHGRVVIQVLQAGQRLGVVQPAVGADGVERIELVHARADRGLHRADVIE